MSIQWLAAAAAAACLPLVAHSWVTTIPRTTSASQLRASSSNDLAGVGTFDEWFSKLGGGAECDESIRHGVFGEALRGLSWTSSAKLNKVTSILSVPKDVVLTASKSDENWDSTLAVQLWKECLKGRQSAMYGYCSLLTRDVDDVSTTAPPSTAPDALRHWTPTQLERLASFSAGAKLMKLQKAQEKSWRAKNDSLDDKSILTWDQFEWSMEAVHSRAFAGDYGLSPVKSIASAAAPLVAGVVGWFYMQNNPAISDAVLLALAALAAAPLALNIGASADDVVLLPLIDSANHLKNADSVIQYDPLKSSFTLSIGGQCLVKENDGTQLFISYGDEKSDVEFLLNYGFLPGLSVAGDGANNRDAARQRLAEEFQRRNP